jgi:antitoxin component of MazEF toxin-antitoxin module
LRLSGSTVITKVITLGAMKKAKKEIPKQVNYKVSALGKGLEEEAVLYSVSSRLRRIGNSRGVILSNRLIEEAGIAPDAELVLKAVEGVIIISEAKKPSRVHTDLAVWEAEFRKMMKKGKKPEGDLFEGMQNSFDGEEWT